MYNVLCLRFYRFLQVCRGIDCSVFGKKHPKKGNVLIARILDPKPLLTSCSLLLIFVTNIAHRICTVCFVNISKDFYCRQRPTV